MSAPVTIIRPTARNIISLWKLEIFNCLLAIAMLGSMYGILRHYDGEPVPDWDIPINLSTLIAFITVIFRTSLVLILAEFIGQAKWKYFVGNGREDPPMRRLIEASRFNDATQGLFGALKLIPTITGHPEILLAIIVIIVSLGTGSFVQQAIQTRLCQFSTDSINASIPISRNITYNYTNNKKRNTPNIAAAISSSLAPDNTELGWPILAECPTGNCTFQNSIGGLYNTLGVCSLCVDTSSLITSTRWTEPYFALNVTEFMGNYTLPNGLSIRAMFHNGSMAGWQDTGLSVSSIRPPNLKNPKSTGLRDWTGDLDWAGDLVNPEMRALSQWAFANVTVLTSNWLPTSFGYTEYLAVTCTLYPCLRTYNASVKMGKLDEVLINTVPVAPNAATSNHTAEALLKAPSWISWEEMMMVDSSTSLEAVQSPCLVDHTVWTKDNLSSTIDKQNLLLLQADPGPNRTRHFKVENTTAPTECIYGMDIMTWQEVMRSMITTTFNGSCYAWSLPSLDVDTEIDCYNSNWLSSFFDDNGITTSDIFERFQAFADRLSNKIRMGLLDNPAYMFGQTVQTTVCVNIGYAWLVFPTVLVCITTGLLAWTVFWNWRRRGSEIVWKTSILPFLFYGERFIVQNGEDMSAGSTNSSRGATKEALMDLHQMQREAKQQLVRFNVLN